MFIRYFVINRSDFAIEYLLHDRLKTYILKIGKKIILNYFSMSVQNYLIS